MPPVADAPPITLQNVSFAYPSGVVVNDVTLTVGLGDYLLLVGANGSGKSTLLKLALGLLEPASGTARLFGMRASDPRARERVGYVPQRTAISARVPATVAEVVAAGRAGKRWIGTFTRTDRAHAGRALERVGLEAFGRRRVGELSGGQQQRVLIARALAHEPGMLVLDEPTAGVDQTSQQQFAALLRELHAAGVTVVVVAHDLGAIGGDITRVLALHQGHLDEISPDTARKQIGLFVKDHAE